MERLGASVQELAREAVEDIMGYDPTQDALMPDTIPKDGHKPPRADIQKMQDVYNHFLNAQHNTDPSGIDISDLDAQKDWKTKYDITSREESYLRAYSVVYKEYQSAQHAFNALAAIYDTRVGDTADRLLAEVPIPGEEPSPEAKKMAGALLKKNEESHLVLLYPAIDRGLTRLYRRSPEAYKLYPWFVKQMKANYTTMLNTQAGDMPPLRSGRALQFEHEADIVGEAGKVLAQLRADNQIPQNFDINKLNLKELEQWLMEWKRDNREIEAQGKVVYEFHNKWTIQKLESAESLQFEGDEMGHCVGGYSNQVESGRTGIYSLRDEKGMPHVTMEIENPHVYKRMSDKPYSQIEPDEFLRIDSEATEMRDHRGQSAGHQPIPDVANAEEAAHWLNLRYENRDMADKLYPGIPHSPTYADVHGNDHDNLYESNGLPWTKGFGVVQVQGKGNKTPKPEYQRMMKEFLDDLRAKGLTFERSDNWYGNWDEYGDDSDNDPSTHRELMDWYESYQSNHHEWQQPKEDAYGMPADRKTVSGGYIDDVIENTANGLLNDYDRSRDRVHDWQGAAQAIYHMMNVLHLQEKVDTPERKEKEKANWLEEIQSQDEKLSESMFGMHDHNWEYINESTQELMEQRADDLGINLEQYEDENGHMDWPRLEQEHEDEWRELQDEITGKEEEEYAGEAFKFLNYLYHLIDQNGHLGPMGVPDPNQTNGGLSSYHEIQENLKIKFPGAFSKVKDTWVAGPPKTSASPYQIVPIDQTNNIWFDEDGESHKRYRPGWAKDETGKMKQTGQDEDSFLDQQGRQGQGVVAYHGNTPVGSLTWVEDPSGQNMMGSAFVHPDHREKGLFNQMSAGLRSSDKPTDAYVWNNPWLKNKVRDWSR